MVWEVEEGGREGGAEPVADGGGGSDCFEAPGGGGSGLVAVAAGRALRGRGVAVTIFEGML